LIEKTPKNRFIVWPAHGPRRCLMTEILYSTAVSLRAAQLRSRQILCRSEQPTHRMRMVVRHLPVRELEYGRSQIIGRRLTHPTRSKTPHKRPMLAKEQLQDLGHATPVAAKRLGSDS
jgi:hypothetical protein